ncbi:hypothetical protein PG616_00925 [Riemerella anatipestifer]|nr:hypothetical protein [Riemerella anatipestifer]
MHYLYSVVYYALVVTVFMNILQEGVVALVGNVVLVQTVNIVNIALRMEGNVVYVDRKIPLILEEGFYGYTIRLIGLCFYCFLIYSQKTYLQNIN